MPGSNKRCLFKEEVGSLSSRMIEGDPCFQRVENEGVMITNKTNINIFIVIFRIEILKNDTKYYFG